MVLPTSFYGPLKDACLYIKHRHRHVKDLDDNFKTLSLRHASLLASKEHIEGKLTFKTKNNKYHELKGQIQEITRKYEQMKSKFKKCRAEHSPRVPTNESVTNSGEGNTSSTQVVQNQHIGRRKIWTIKFFKNARLDKDVQKLIGEINALKIEDVKLETLVTEDIYAQRKNAPRRAHTPLWRYVEKILEYLENESTKRIGIFGEPQVGKSTVLKELNNCFHSSLRYKIVIWLNFPSKNSGDVKEKIQQEILRSINEHDEQSLERNADKINKALVKVKYLLILDDVYERIDLGDLGIHDDHELGKIVIGATGEGVLNRMNVDESILIKKLDSDDAEKFFKESLGAKPSDDLSTIQPYIKKIIELLGGHIGALVGIADYMKGLGNHNKGLNVWKALVNDLQSPNSLGNLELGALEKAYKLLYENLKDNNLRKCLLYVALFPVGYHAHTSYLVECWKAEEFLHGCHTYEEARYGGTLVFSHLTESRLLEWFGKEYLKMPLLFRKVALHIPYPDEGDNRILVRNISEIHKHPCEQDWEIAKRISLMCGKLEILPNQPMCNNTSTLLLQASLELREIGDLFFNNMGTLRVLDLQRTGINELPKSISNLGYLKCLYLNDCCSLKSLRAEIKELNQLEMLDIRRTSMHCLPCEIWFLKTLRCLRISVRNSRESKGIVMLPQQPYFSREFLKLRILEELTVHVDPQIPDKRVIVDQIKEVLKEAEHKHYLKVTWEPKEFIASTGSQSNCQDITLPHSSSPITEHATQLEISEASTSTANSQHTGSTKEWAQKTFHDN